MIISNKRALLAAAAAATLGLAGTASAQSSGFRVERVAGGLVITPPSGVSSQGFMHTNYKIFQPNGARAFASQPSGRYETPASLACVYGLTKQTAGCNPETLKTVATGGAKVVAIVDAFDYPTAANDLDVFSQQFGLPRVSDQNFQVVYATGTKPNQDPSGGWEVEEALDIEMAHAMAPDAKVVLVEAASNSGHDLLVAEKAATALVEQAGGGEVSNSWSGGEFKTEEGSEKHFSGKNVVYFASSGDAPGEGWPSVLQNVVSVGGTQISRDTNGNFLSQGSWPATGGGLSQYVPRPTYQKSVKKVVGTQRGNPDVSLDAAPASGAWIYDTTPTGNGVPNWTVVGGTSLSSPAMAGIINNAGTFAASTPAELAIVYKNAKNSADWTDITTGGCNNPKSGGTATKGYDLCTGVGVPNGLAGK